jgi:sugar phosphate isomerase/epimerase
MKSAVTVCLVPEARQGPFVFHGATAAEALDVGCRRAAELGFDAVEVFPTGPEQLADSGLAGTLADHGLGLAAVGSGAGWVRHKLSLTHADARLRAEARDFIELLVNIAADHGAPVIIGSMQGRHEGDVSRADALEWLADSLDHLGRHAAGRGQTLLYEPLNRYETNLFTQVGEAATFLRGRGLHTVKLLCDLFHMNIEEADPAAALVACGDLVGHVHWADSNRRAMGSGHTSTVPIAVALRHIGYAGYLSAEVFPFPDADTAARMTIESIRALAAIAPRSTT